MKLLTSYGLSAWIVGALTLTFSPALVSNQRSLAAYAQSAPESQETLAHEIGQRITRVPEFKFIREEAQRMGVHAYLFGGTAAGFAHYVNWDLKRESGDTRFQPDRFDYDYTDIYRSTQDLDIVIDGPPEKAQKLQAKLAEIFPHLQGNKSAWEVRLLRQDMGDKQALLNNPDFLNQHTDSNSTGMIEITPPENDEPVVRDLRDWNSKDPYFLRDVREGKLHYYFSPKHAQTKFAKEGRNPPIISVIRYLTKAFQYELEIRPEDLAQIKQIIDEFDPKGREMKNDYVRNWLLKKDNGRKLIQNAVNIEYAWDTLEKLGLRKKLIAIENDPDTEQSLAWWMSKEPLRSRPLGSGGKSIRDLIAQGALPSDLTVAHETNNFLAYESITRAHTGAPNVLISRNNKAGEAAVHGNGFYTQIGRTGARGTGITIRFQVDPNAKEGVDFTRAGSYLIFQNKNALRVIPESLNITPLQYFEFLANGDKIDTSERAIFEKLKRKVTAAQGALSDEDYQKLRSVVAKSIENGDFNEPLIKEWAALPKSAEWSHDLFDPLLKMKVFDIPLSEMVLVQPQFAKIPKFAEINTIVRRLTQSIPKFPGPYDPLFIKALHSQPDDALRLAYPLLGQLEDESISTLFKEILPKCQSESFTLKVIEEVLLRPRVLTERHTKHISDLITQVFTQPRTKNWKRAKAALIERIHTYPQLDELFAKVLSHPELSDEDSAIAVIKQLHVWNRHHVHEIAGPHFQKVAEQILTKPFAKNWTRAQSEFIQNVSSPNVLLPFVDHILSPPYSTDPKTEELTLQAIQRIASLRLVYENQYPSFIERLNSAVANHPVLKNSNRVRMQLLNYAEPPLLQTLVDEIVHRTDRADYISKLIGENSIDIDEGLARAFYGSSDLTNDTNLLRVVFGRPKLTYPLFELALVTPSILQDPPRLAHLISIGPPSLDPKTEGIMIHAVFKSSTSHSNAEAIGAVAKKYPDRLDVVNQIFARKDLLQHPEWIEPLIHSSQKQLDYKLLDLLKDPAWKDRTDWLQTLVKRKLFNEEVFRKLLKQPHWKNHPALRQMCGGRAPDIRCLSTGEPTPTFSACVVKSLKGLFSR
jgi:hypothetical protein